MRCLLPPLALSLALVARAAPNGCLPAEHDPITARDLASALPVFAGLAPETPIAAAPGPGARRVFRPLELTSIARRNSLPLDSPEEVCFDLPMQVLDRARALEAMRAALPLPETRIQITETSLYPVPRGRLEFRREDLVAPALPNSQTPVIWRGNVVYGADQHFAIWARVIVTARLSRLTAAESIKRGSLITADQIRVESALGFPLANDFAASPDQVVGRIATRPIAAGTEVRLSFVERPQDVKRGDTVEIQVHSGSARLALTAKSESDGRIGDTIAVRNLRSNKIFQARVEGKDRAFVDAALPQGN